MMAARIMTYVCLLPQDLIKRREIVAPDHPPPVFPAVIYNGKTSWRSGRDMVELIAPQPADLQRYLLRHRYFLLDEGREETPETDNAVSDVIALETGPSQGSA